MKLKRCRWEINTTLLIYIAKDATLDTLYALADQESAPFDTLFMADISDYILRVPAITDTVIFNFSANSRLSTVSITRNVTICMSNGGTTVVITVSSRSGNSKNYTIELDINAAAINAKLKEWSLFNQS